MAERLHIPYEKAPSPSLSNGGRSAIVNYFKEHREAQMKYTKKTVESGVYRAWITQVTNKELEGFMVENQKRLEKGLQYNTYGPKLEMDYFWRNALYRLELLYRMYGPELSEDLHDKWQDEVISDQSYWAGKYKVARLEWERKKGILANENASAITPYY